ncbi:MAG TPA: hypothetical protein VFE30_12815 [Anaeromyxobacteraceae bacterium]|jgi:hypothetical protein|nr:hypothetical protein [Anaeromyxobacteraceae bacterium]
MAKVVALLWVLAAPALVQAQAFTLRPPSFGEELQDVDRLMRIPPRALHREGEPLPQTFVMPERPGQNQVAWFEFDWRRLDVPPPAGGRGGIRLYYYEREREVAERALPAIRAAYLRLVDQFHYSPTKPIPYILYSSQREFQTTNVFQVTESVLGVTSPVDLKMSLPYFGDHEKFREVSTHELVHQFTIQKLIDLSGEEDPASPLDEFPLWFIEGIAEYYAKGGLDAESDAFLRDLVWNPDPEHHYEILSFAEDRYRGYLPTYKLGQARVTFIAEAYGKEKIQAYLENAFLMGTGRQSQGERGFAALTRRVLGEPLEQVDARWRAWLKKRYYPDYLRIRQDLPSVREIQKLPAEPDSYVASADGQLLLFRGLDREQGRARVYLADVRSPEDAEEVAEDDGPGVESLHPVEHGILALSRERLAFAALDGPGDVLYLRDYTHRPPEKGHAAAIGLGPRRRLAVLHPQGLRFIEISDPAFSPDGRELAFVGLTERGQQDVYVVPVTGGVARQVTDDPYAERDLAWGEGGIYCSSDATDHGRFNLFRVDPRTGARTRLTTAAVNDRYPHPRPDGSLVYSSDAGGRTDLYLLEGGRTRRLTEFATGVQAPAPAPDGRGLYATTFYRGRFRLIEVPRAAVLEDAFEAQPDAAGPPLEIPLAAIPPQTPTYQPFTLSNWKPDAGIVYGGGGAGAVAGRAALLFTDILRDHVVYLDLAVYGSFDYTQAMVLYEDRSRRNGFAFGAYHFVQQQLDRLDRNLAYFQRDFGLIGALRFPLDRYQRLETELSFGALQRYCLTDLSPSLGVFLDPQLGVITDCSGIQSAASPAGTTADWRARNGGINPTVTPTVRYGYDTVRFDQYTGPIDGTSLLYELGGQYLPGRSALTAFTRFDAAHWFQLIGRANLMARVAAGSSFAPEAQKTWAKSWWLTSADNLRGFGPLDTAYLVGQSYYVANLELQVPLDGLIHLFIFDYLEGVAALDFGGVFNRFESRNYTVCDGGSGHCVEAREAGAWESRTLTGVLGANVLFGPLLFRIHFGHPFDIKGQRTPAMISHTPWVTNITLRYFFF